MANDLERLKREGAAKLAEAEREQRERDDDETKERRERDRNALRLAIGRYRYRAARKTLFWTMLPGLPMFGIGLLCTVLDLLGPAGVAITAGGAFWLFGGLLLWGSSWVWRASDAAVAEEQRWLDAQPFEIVGYFEWLPRSGDEASLDLVIRGPRVHEKRDDVRLLLAAIHPHVRSDADKEKGGGSRFVLSDINGGDDDQRVRIFHEIIERVLVPLHHESAIEKVTIRH